VAALLCVKSTLLYTGHALISVLSVLFLRDIHVMTCQRDTMQTHQRHELTGTSQASRTASVCTAAIAVQSAFNASCGAIQTSTWQLTIST
jgi:hypothetical protein